MFFTSNQRKLFSVGLLDPPWFDMFFKPTFLGQ